MEDVLAAGLTNPVGNWVSQWKGGWNSTPSTSAAVSASHTGLILIVLIVLFALVTWVALKKIAN